MRFDARPLRLPLLPIMRMLTFAFCTFNRADRLPALVGAMRAQQCPMPFEILAVNNNSTDRTADALDALVRQGGAPLRWVNEPVQGIVAARNRAIAESLDSDILVFIDDDEMPLPGLLTAVTDAIVNEGAQCVGGRIDADLSGHVRPRWLDDELLGFYGAVNHGDKPFWIDSEDTPVWSGNVAYDMRLIRQDPALRFDRRYDRVGAGIGGGSDHMMLRALLERHVRIRYRPDMAILHAVDDWKLRRRYFLRLHYRAGMRHGQYELPDYPRRVSGVPPFLFVQFLKHCAKTLGIVLKRQPGLVRQAMNASFALGAVVGYRARDAQA